MEILLALNLFAKFMMVLLKLGLTWVYIMAILFAEFDRKKWWCYLVMVLSIVMIWV